MPKPTKQELEAIAALSAGAAPCPEDTALALAALSPQISRVVFALQERRTERRKLLWQALALAGGIVLFAAVALLGWRNLDYLLESPCRWGLAAGVLAAVLMLTCCLPLLGGQRRGVQTNG